MFSNVYHRRKILITGHTGFKGSWLALWLETLGADVVGLALPPPTSPNHWELLRLQVGDERGDVRDFGRVREVVDQAQPEIVFHLAAQPLVRRSYREPLETWSTNVLGTANVLEACRGHDSVRAVVVITTDKCYQNKEQTCGYRESDTLGGHDPYSASKAAAEFVVASYRQSYFGEKGSPILASARAGNVIGGGDWSEDRLIPDAARAMLIAKPLDIRSPEATRPWQHVLDSLSGYLLLGQRLLEGDAEFGDAWNFGPVSEDVYSVATVLRVLQSYWPTLKWHRTDTIHPHETKLLQLDSTKARELLRWQPVWRFERGLELTAAWYSQYYDGRPINSREQLALYIDDAQQAGRSWAR